MMHGGNLKKTGCVHCGVRTEFLNTLQVNCLLSLRKPQIEKVRDTLDSYL